MNDQTSTHASCSTSLIFAAAIAFCCISHADDSLLPPATRLTRSNFPKFFLSHSPDGSHLTYSRHHDNRRAANKVLMGLRIVAADGANDRPLLAAYDSQVQIQEHGSWSPDGRHLLITGGGNDAGNSTKDAFICDVDVEFQATNLRKVLPGEGVRVGEQASWSPDGKKIVAVTTSRTLLVFDRSGENRRALLQTPGNYCFQPAWSPDGEWIAFASDRDGNSELYKVREDGTDLTRLTHHPGVDCRPKWSPDGEWLAFTSNRSGNEDLYVMRADGGTARNLTANSAVDDHAAWSPDGKSIAFISMRDGGFDLYRIETPPDLQVAPKPAPRTQPREAPDRLVAHYRFDEAVEGQLRDEKGGNHLQLVGGAIVPEGAGGALSLDGEDDCAVLPLGSALSIGGPLTVTLWLRPQRIAGNGYVLSKHGWNIYLGPDGLLRFETRTAANTAWDTLTATEALRAGRWSMAAAVFDPDAKTLSLYVNGKLAGSKPRTDGGLGGVDGLPLELGRYNASKSQYYTGQLDELRIYRRALGEDELQLAWEQQAGDFPEEHLAVIPTTPRRAVTPRDGLMAHYACDAASGETVRDEKGQNPLKLHGVRVAAEGQRGALEFAGDNAYADAGNGDALQIDGPLTISLWVRPDKQTSNGYLVSKHGWNIYLGPDLVPRFETRTANDDAWDTLAAKSALPVGRWSFVTAVFDPRQKAQTVYVDGAASAQRPREDGRIGSALGYPLVLGTYVASKSQNYAGRMDEIRIYRKALSPADVAREHEAQRGQVVAP